MNSAIGKDLQWTASDGIVVINLDRRKDRWSRMEPRLREIFSLTPIVRISAVDGVDIPGYGEKPYFRGRKRDRVWAGRAGCTLSHRKAIEYARAAGWKRVLILEDDVIFTTVWSTHIGAIQDALQKNDDQWQVCYLGQSEPAGIIGCVATPCPDQQLVAACGALCAHAYILKATTYDWLLERLPDGRAVWNWLAHHGAVDRWYLHHLCDRFGVVLTIPSIVVQETDFSDIGQRVADYDGYHGFSEALPKPSRVWNAATVKTLYRIEMAYKDIIGSVMSLLKRFKGF